MDEKVMDESLFSNIDSKLIGKAVKNFKHRAKQGVIGKWINPVSRICTKWGDMLQQFHKSTQPTGEPSLHSSDTSSPIAPIGHHGLLERTPRVFAHLVDSGFEIMNKLLQRLALGTEVPGKREAEQPIAVIGKIRKALVPRDVGNSKAGDQCFQEGGLPHLVRERAIIVWPEGKNDLGALSQAPSEPCGIDIIRKIRLAAQDNGATARVGPEERSVGMVLFNGVLVIDRRSSPPTPLHDRHGGRRERCEEGGHAVSETRPKL